MERSSLKENPLHLPVPLSQMAGGEPALQCLAGQSSSFLYFLRSESTQNGRTKRLKRVVKAYCSRLAAIILARQKFALPAAFYNEHGTLKFWFMILHQVNILNVLYKLEQITFVQGTIIFLSKRRRKDCIMTDSK